MRVWHMSHICLSRNKHSCAEHYRLCEPWQSRLHQQHVPQVHHSKSAVSATAKSAHLLHLGAQHHPTQTAAKHTPSAPLDCICGGCCSICSCWLKLCCICWAVLGFKGLAAGACMASAKR
jgi:hypothetical protein